VCLNDAKLTIIKPGCPFQQQQQQQQQHRRRKRRRRKRRRQKHRRQKHRRRQHRRRSHGFRLLGATTIRHTVSISILRFMCSYSISLLSHFFRLRNLL
jgi:hypothetical protein